MSDFKRQRMNITEKAASGENISQQQVQDSDENIGYKKDVFMNYGKYEQHSNATGDSDKIMGINRTVFIIGVVALVVGGYLAFKHYSKKKAIVAAPSA